MDKQPTEARQDELAGIQKEMAHIIALAAVHHTGKPFLQIADQILSLPVSSGGGVCPRCYGMGISEIRCNAPKCLPCNGTGQKPIVTKKLIEWVKLGTESVK